MFSKFSHTKVLVVVLVTLVLVESISGILSKIKKNKRKNKFKNKGKDSGEERCDLGINCKPGCYCSKRTCRPNTPPKNAAEAKWKCSKKFDREIEYDGSSSSSEESYEKDKNEDIESPTPLPEIGLTVVTVPPTERLKRSFDWDFWDPDLRLHN